MVEAESEVVLLPSFVFVSMLHILMMHAAVQLCGGWCCQIRYVLRPVYAPFPLCGPTDGKMCNMLEKVNTLQFPTFQLLHHPIILALWHPAWLPHTFGHIEVD